MGESIDIINGKIIYTDKNSVRTVVNIELSMISDFNTQTVGDKELTLTYNNCTLKVPYTVNAWDMVIGALYMSQTPEPYVSYSYIMFESATSVLLVFNKTTQAIPSNSEGERCTCTSEIVNGKKVYTAVPPYGGTFVIRVENGNTLQQVGGLQYTYNMIQV